jgi:putative PIN family toxin of toxin-antitoxin system
MNIVLDTNAWLDCLVFKNPSANFILEAIHSKKINTYTCMHMFNEFKRVLSYTQIQPYIGQLQTQNNTNVVIETIYNNFLQHSIFLDTPDAQNFAYLPKCKDRDDQIFLNFCVQHAIGILITKDKHLLKMHKHMRKFNVYITNIDGLSILHG